MRENYLAKWLNNELTEEEQAAFERSEEYASMSKIVEATDSLDSPSFDIDLAYEELKNSRMQDPVKVIQLKPYYRFLKVAAVAVALMALSVFYLRTLDETVVAEYAQRTEITLPDNSEVILNAGSEITYNEKRWDKERNVELQGEAFFKVAKGEKFTVSTSQGTIAVLGTQFNVENRREFFEVTCYEGLVNVTYNDSDYRLPAGSSFVVIKNEIQPTTEVMVTQPSWLVDESTFKSIPLGFVLDELERQFNIKVTSENVDLTQLFTGSFSNTNLNLALQSISTPTQIEYEVDGNKVLFYAKNSP